MFILKHWLSFRKPHAKAVFLSPVKPGVISTPEGAKQSGGTVNCPAAHALSFVRLIGGNGSGYLGNLFSSPGAACTCTAPAVGFAGLRAPCPGLKALIHFATPEKALPKM